MPKHQKRLQKDGSVCKAISFPPQFWNRMLPFVNAEADGNLSVFVRNLARAHMAKRGKENVDAA